MTTDGAAMLRRVTAAPEWLDMPADVRRAQLRRFLAAHPECADLPELAGVTPDAGARPELEYLATGGRTR
jgi:hypothetical protein